MYDSNFKIIDLFAEDRGFRRNELRKIEQTVRENVEHLRDEWDC